GTYIAVTIPLLMLILLLLVANVPSVLGLAREGMAGRAETFRQAQQQADALGPLVAAAELLILALPVVTTVYLIYKLTWAPARALWRWSRPTAQRRALGALAATACLAFVGY